MVPEFVKIKNLDDQSFEYGLSSTFVKVANLAGIKEDIGDINKTDIAQMIALRFKSLSLEEIDYAFKLERYGSYPERTQHFQLFNAEYVSQILDKYKTWRHELRVSRNISIFGKTEVPSLPEISESQKEEIVKLGLKRCYAHYQQHKNIPNGSIYLYDYLDEKNLMPIDKPTKDAVLKIAKQNIKDKSELATTIEERRSLAVYDSIGNPSSKVITECKRLSLISFLKKFSLYEQLEKKL